MVILHVMAMRPAVIVIFEDAEGCFLSVVAVVLVSLHLVRGRADWYLLLHVLPGLRLPCASCGHHVVVCIRHVGRFLLKLLCHGVLLRCRVRHLLLLRRCVGQLGLHCCHIRLHRVFELLLVFLLLLLVRLVFLSMLVILLVLLQHPKHRLLFLWHIWMNLHN